MIQLTESANGQVAEVQLPTVAQHLRQLGLSNDTIAHVTGQPRAVIREIVTQRVVPPEEEQLASEVRNLFHLAIAQAHRILEWGPTEQKIQIIKSLLSGSAIRFAHTAGGEGQEVRREMEVMMEQIRSVPVPTEVVQHSGEVYEEYAEAGTPPQPTDDQD